MGFFSKIKEGLTKTRKAMEDTLSNVFSGFSSLDDDFYDELEECLILADLGVETAGRAVERLRRRVKSSGSGSRRRPGRRCGTFWWRCSRWGIRACAWGRSPL